MRDIKKETDFSNTGYKLASMEKQFIFNILDFIWKNDREVTLDKSNGKGFLGELIEDFSTRYLWLKFLDTMRFDTRTRMLFEYIKDSLDKEDYSKSYQLKKEISRSCGITDQYISEVAYRMLQRFAQSIDQYPRFRYLIKDVNRMFFEFEFNDKNKYSSIFQEIEILEFELELKVDPDSELYNLEIADMVNRDLIPHPYVFIHQLKFFFSFLQKNREFEFAYVEVN